MTSRQRVKLAMRRQQPDRVPYWCQLGAGHVERNARRPIVTGNDWLQANCDLAKDYGFDGLLVSGAMDRTDLARPRGESRWGAVALQHDLGTTPFESLDPAALCPKPPAYTADQFEGCHRARQLMGYDCCLAGFTTGPFARAVEWFGWPPGEKAFFALADDPGRFKALVEYLTEYSIAFATAQVRLGGVDAIDISDPYAGSTFISRQMYRELVFPGQRRLAAAIRAAGGMSYLHVCGFVGDRLELMVDTGVDGIECLDPPPLGDVQLDEAKRRVGDRVFLKGNLDSVNTLWRGSDDQVRAAVRGCLAHASKGGGYILSSACSVAPEVPPARMRMIGDMVRELG